MLVCFIKHFDTGNEVADVLAFDFLQPLQYQKNKTEGKRSGDDRTDRKRLVSILTAFTLSFIFHLLSAKCIYPYNIISSLFSTRRYLNA